MEIQIEFNLLRMIIMEQIIEFTISKEQDNSCNSDYFGFLSEKQCGLYKTIKNKPTFRILKILDKLTETNQNNYNITILLTW